MIENGTEKSSTVKGSNLILGRLYPEVLTTPPYRYIYKDQDINPQEQNDSSNYSKRYWIQSAQHK